MKTRRALASDVDEVIRLLEDGKATLRETGVDQWQDGYPGREDAERDVIRGESYLMIDADGSALAVATIGLSGRREYDSLYGGSWLTDSDSQDPRYVALCRLAVSKEKRGRGIASRMLQEVQKICTELGRESVRVDTHEDNVPMRTLLEKRGFRKCGFIHAAHVKRGSRVRVVYEKVVDLKDFDIQVPAGER